MKTWILQTGEPLHCDAGSPRPMRAMNLANALVERGHEVVLWSSAFSHQEKRHRSKGFKVIRISGSLAINLIPSRGYHRNIGLGRLIDHAQLAHNLSRLLKNGKLELPDVAFIGYPPIETAATLTRWLKSKQVPTMLDAKDQWPTIFVEPLPNWLRPVGRLALIPYFHFARQAMKDADAFCAMSDEFIDWMCDFAGRARREADCAVPLTAPRMQFDDTVLENAFSWWAERGVDTKNRRRVSFIGTLSSVFDFSIVRNIAERCLRERVDCQFVICGDGGAAPVVRRLMAGLNNVVMPGWIDAPKIAALTQCSVASIAPYVNDDAFMRSIPNKIIDSLANNLPILTTLQGVVEKLVTKENVGFCSDSSDEMLNFLTRLLGDQTYWSAMSSRAKTVYDLRFSSDKVYDGLVDALERLVQ